ncbi:hypothetical protein ACIQUY_31880 [Streptomyces sp. NPDC090231]|uniref:hypothetical protein n=1 Tax=unclassified Streptomyces TaxID=2593676 RepID=UPI00380BCB6E
MPFDQYRTVVAAIDRLTTQVGRVADAMATPVVEVDDAPQTTGDDAAMNLKRGPWVPACESGRHVVHGGMDCDEVDQFQARFGQWASSVSAQFDSFMTASDAPQTTDDDGPRLVSWLPVPEQDRELRALIDAALEQADYRMDMRRGDLADAVLPVLAPGLAVLRAKVREQQATIERVRALHRRETVQTTGGPAEACATCEADSMSHPWPCPTIEALSGPDETEPDVVDQPTDPFFHSGPR